MPEDVECMNSTNKLIVRLKGGLGNQLFTYAVAKTLALRNHAELVIDDKTCFEKDITYQRTYQLMNFNVEARLARPAERLEPFKTIRDKWLVFISKRTAFNKRKFVFQQQTSYDKRLNNLTFSGTLFFEGYWQSERYFKDAEAVLRQQLSLKNKLDPTNEKVLQHIKQSNSVALHLRWFDDPGTDHSNNVGIQYYTKALDLIRAEIQNPHFFIFSDKPEAAAKVLSLNSDECTVVDHNSTDDEAHKDLWLMSNCSSIIMANSSFSWWAAWLNEPDKKLVICPEQEINHPGRITSWNFEGQLPERWIKI